MHDTFEVIKFGTAILLLAGLTVYAVIVAVALIFYREQSLAKLILGAPVQSMGLPLSAVAAFGLVSLLDFGTTGENFEFEAFSVTFTGPAAPLTLWVVCYVTFVWSIRATSKNS